MTDQTKYVLFMWNWDRFPEDEEGFYAREPYSIGTYVGSAHAFRVADKLEATNHRVDYSLSSPGKKVISYNKHRYDQLRRARYKGFQWPQSTRTTKQWLQYYK